ncbi:transcriptional regulator NrdR [Candidatus Kuenenbacteria bacterium RIFCSPLOWO2_12_FULL_42_13]|uniref:Transcriptional repressor NrdR n=5 Tax=Candidatus Kueneniibacteriota TaxID=1752740 RepID=A0A0G0YT32_9BACT|nr:MAG: Transcriptional repressor NrdR [Candidatus Kuenenbacteria bacterium GW2011_GWA2_42_15]OGG90547.1 MAG: transcriptional regulator NrdR [Candidatus Kuenenbacteria bacterium RIFCSPLOWO2_02_FULL_42_16]OGG92251.1 MAG: transcriptional regulator NrdR [Candidatus Kuenenbacteria bacterium RIFCSPLOWO2_12_FULL_42_13]OGG95810.1 MAG: transcriptional regulator NrdR [Candidatus Kuenenbacteria bacterium RBG_16_41_7]OGG98670.1 MAG: transcriptional regulator NrdR [Candidatus Kuenenbacteria bacterium RIFCS
MFCPVCNCKDTNVVDSRLAGDGLSVRRRRRCAKCDFRFSTTEEMQILELTVIKRDGRHEVYNREKLESGIVHALEKRSYTKDEFKLLINKIERDIQKKASRNEITTHDIGELVMKYLEKFDKIAYIRFASVYRQFEDVSSFQKELRRMSPKNTRKNK